ISAPVAWGFRWPPFAATLAPRAASHAPSESTRTPSWSKNTARNSYRVPSMFDHVTIRVSDFDASERFYATVLETLGIEQSSRTEGFARWQHFMITATA